MKFTLEEVLLLVGAAMFCAIAASHLDAESETARLEALPLPVLVCPKRPAPDLNAICPGWLFNTNLEKAKEKICKKN